ncbi:MAG: hypothetical protein Q7R41_11950, partial [Phycisphaerales bacterium]|nr:hypothetical protein [Phycisphaerales bacterium]
VEANVNSFTCNFTRGSGDTTPFLAATNYRTSLGTNMRLEGSLDGWFDGTTPFAATTWDSIVTSVGAAAGTFDLYGFDTQAGAGTDALKISFTGWLSGYSVSAKRGAIVTFSAKFVSTGTPTIALAAGV